MPDVLVVTGALAAGGLCSTAVISIARDSPALKMPSLISERLVTMARQGLSARLAQWLSSSIERAGWDKSPARVTVSTLGLACALAVAGWAIGPAFSPVGFALGCGAVFVHLNSAIERRRRRLAGELVPLLELFTLELSGGGSALSALGSVTVQVEGELAADLRRILIASHMTGSATFESRLIDYSDRTRIPALASLATLLAASREYGTGTSHGVRALAADLRRAQRRELIEHSRKALNHVLLPAALGVLLPFLGVLMFPAVSVLQRSLR